MAEKRKPEYVIKKYSAVAVWNYENISEKCPICRNDMQDICVDCTANQNEDCPLAWGVCNHAFHFHCIHKWLKKKSVCPLDQTCWEFQRFERGNPTMKQ